MLAAGIDGCRGGWVIARRKDTTRPVKLLFAKSLSEAFNDVTQPTTIAIDMPIGLPESEYRACDIAARKVLGPKRQSSLFFAPPRCVLQANTHREAGDLAFAATGKRISIQAWNLLPKIRELADWIESAPPSFQTVETHPELCFARLSDNGALAASKKSSEGNLQRETLLATWFGKKTLDTALAWKRPPGVAADDLLDALVSLITAERIPQGDGWHLPPTDSTQGPTIWW